VHNSGRFAPRECEGVPSPSSCPAKAGHPVRRGFSVQARTSLEYWITRPSAQLRTRRVMTAWLFEIRIRHRGRVIARSEATKQSMAQSLRIDGLLRFARNDDATPTPTGDCSCSASCCRARPVRGYCSSRRRDGPWWCRGERWARCRGPCSSCCLPGWRNRYRHHGLRYQRIETTRAMAGSFPGGRWRSLCPAQPVRSRPHDQQGRAGSGGRKTIGHRPAPPLARRLAVNDFETTATDTLYPLAHCYFCHCYFCRSVHNGAGPQEPIEHRQVGA
jgi:hypothetical protein